MSSVFYVLLSISLSCFFILVSIIIREISRQLKSYNYKIASTLISILDPSILLTSLFSCIVAKYVCDFIFGA
jgi:hypothetical protein